MKDEQLDILLENAGLEPINAIELDGVNIGRDINDRFESIENNFGAIVYTDYLKGDKGDSLKFFKATIHLNADGTFDDKNIVDGIDIYYQRDGEYKKLDSESLYILIQEAFIDDNYKPIISNINNSISLICEYILLDGEYKYIKSYREGYKDHLNDTTIAPGSAPYLYALQGNRSLDRKYFLRNRLNFLQGKYASDAF